MFYAYPISRCIVCARGAAMACHTVLVICKGSRWLCRIARLYGRAAPPVATAVCAGFADHRAELRLSPEVRSSRMTIGTLRKAGTGVRRFPSRVSKVGVYELLLSRRHNARRRGDKVHTLLRPRRKAQEVVEEPRRQVVVLWRQMEAI